MKPIQVICRTFLVIVTVLSLQGCDQMRDKISNFFANKTPQQVLELANQKIANHQYKEALAELESYGKSDPAYDGELAWAAAKSCFQLGEVDKGYTYLIKAIKANSALAQEAMVEPLFESVRTEIRFVTLVTETTSSAPAASATTDVNAGNDVSIKMNSSGATEVKAGSVSIKLQ